MREEVDKVASSPSSRNFESTFARIFSFLELSMYYISPFSLDLSLTRDVMSAWLLRAKLGKVASEGFFSPVQSNS